MELISVIVPVYKIEEYLDKCVSSIVNQTYSNLEIILVDDGSPDRCGSMCEDWAKKDARIRVLHKSNGGLSDARNAGMEISTGAYTAFVDSDDWIAPDFIQKLYDAIQSTGAQIAGCDICVVYLDEDPVTGDGTGQLRTCTTEEAIDDILQNKGFRAVAWNKLYLSSLLKGERYPVGKHHEDEFFTYRIFGKAEKMVYVDKPMYFYLQRQGSIMHSFTIKRLDALEAYLERIEYLREHFPGFYRRDKIFFCTSCAFMYCKSQKLQDPSAAAVRKKIKQLRRQISFSLSEYRETSAKQLVYVLGTGLCMGAFCAVLNCRKLERKIRGGLGKRIIKRIKATVKSFQSDLHFSPHFAFLRLGSELGGRLHLHKISKHAANKKSRWTEDYLEKQLEPVLKSFENDTDIGQYEPAAPVWVCWWTGEETAPALVRRCLRSIRENANGHPVHLITKENCSDYVDIPEYMLSKVEDGTMCVAHFADYLRFALLAKYGGLWLDATMFCSHPLLEKMFQVPVFTCKGRTGDAEFCSDYMWTVFSIGGYRGNVMFRLLRDLLEAYWKQNQIAIDYLFLDHTIKLVYSKHKTCKELIDGIPENNLHRDDLQAAMNAGVSALEIGGIIRPDTILYKLSWREIYKTKTPEGKDSVYGAFIKGHF